MLEADSDEDEDDDDEETPKKVFNFISHSMQVIYYCTLKSLVLIIVHF